MGRGYLKMFKNNEEKTLLHPCQPLAASLTKFLTIISNNYIRVEKDKKNFDKFLGVSTWGGIT